MPFHERMNVAHQQMSKKKSSERGYLVEELAHDGITFSWSIILRRKMRLDLTTLAAKLKMPIKDCSWSREAVLRVFHSASIVSISDNLCASRLTVMFDELNNIPRKIINMHGPSHFSGATGNPSSANSFNICRS